MNRPGRLLVTLFACLGMIVFMGNGTRILADENDPPHQTHLTDKGAKFFLDVDVDGSVTGDECLRCHTGTPAYDNVDTNRCAECHTTGGFYDGVNNSEIGVLNNWQDLGLSTDRKSTRLNSSHYS